MINFSKTIGYSDDTRKWQNLKVKYASKIYISNPSTIGTEARVSMAFVSASYDYFHELGNLPINTPFILGNTMIPSGVTLMLEDIDSRNFGKKIGDTYKEDLYIFVKSTEQVNITIIA